MLYWLDTEFIERGPDYPIDLISIGIIAEDGREYYAQSSQFNWETPSDWVKENVYPHLRYCSLQQKTDGGVGTILLSKVYHEGIAGVGYDGKCTFSDCPWRTREQLKRDILAFMDPLLYGKPELWGWCSGYDFVAFCQIFGTMMDLPASYPHYIRDLQQILDERGISDEELPEQEEGLHNALDDARHLKRLWGYIVRNDCWQ